MLALSLFTTAFIGTAVARIAGVAAPATIAPNSKIDLTLLTENYIQSVEDISVVFGLVERASPGYIGYAILGSFYLGPTKSNTLQNLTFEVTTPATIWNETKYLSAVVTSLYGVGHSATTIGFDVPVKIGKTTSTKRNSNYDGTNTCPGANGAKREATPSLSARGCFPDNTHKLVQDSEVAIGNVINNIYQQDNATGKANLVKTNQALNALKGAVHPASSCNNPPPGAWPPLSPRDSQARAIDILRNAQDALQNVDLKVNECDKPAAASIFCQARSLVSNIDVYYRS